MGEVGCLKDGNFQNLETNGLFVGGRSLRAAAYSNLGTIGDAAAAGNLIPATSLTENGVHIIIGNGTTDKVTVTMPALAAVPAIGTFYTFVLGARSTTANGGGNGHTIKLPAAGAGGGWLCGSVRLVRATGGAAHASNTTELVHIFPLSGTDEMIEMQSDDATGGGEPGSFITLTYIGLVDGTNPGWFVDGTIVSSTVASTGATSFAAWVAMD